MEPDSKKKLRRAANIKTFHEIKNFLFTSFFSLTTVLTYNNKNLFFYKDRLRHERNTRLLRVKIISCSEWQRLQCNRLLEA
jgi:hypothetical protein